MGNVSQWSARALPDGLAQSVQSAAPYVIVPDSTTAQLLGATGAIGDALMGLLVIPTSTSPGEIDILDGETSITVFAGGVSSLLNLNPFFIPLGMIAQGAGWSITTGANCSVIAMGYFT